MIPKAKSSYFVDILDLGNIRTASLVLFFLPAPIAAMTTDSIPAVPALYKLFFIYIEPISALAGAYYAAFQPTDYLRDLSLVSSTSTSTPSEPLSTQMTMTLLQLANLYLLFALNEHLVLSSSPPLKTWRRLLLVLLIADFGHLATMVPLGLGVFWRVWEWNAMVWGSVGFVYLGATMRMCFLAGVGLGNKTVEGKGKRV